MPAKQEMNPEIERRIRERAYKIWEDQGRPAGREIDHWTEACERVAAEDGQVSGLGQPLDEGAVVKKPRARTVRGKKSAGG